MESTTRADRGADAGVDGAVIRQRFTRFRDQAGVIVEQPVVAEIRLTINLDGEELVQLMCSPHQLNALVVGFLYHEGIIDQLDDVDAIRLCLEDRVADVWLGRRLPEMPRRKIITSGCTGGASFGLYLDHVDELRLPDDDLSIEPARIYRLLRELHDRAQLYRLSGGIHTSLLADGGGQPLIVSEDIGRHNTVDKLRGETLLRGMDTRAHIIIASGRISSEMLLKAAVMGVSVVGSRTSPTQLAIELAEHLNITVIGYIRSSSMNVYTHAGRIAGNSAL